MSALADGLMIALTALMLGLLGAGVAAGARRAGREASARRLAGQAVAALVGWLAVVAALAASGGLAVWTSRPPRWPLLPLTAFVAIFVLVRSAPVKALIDSAPRVWPIGAQTFRVGVELALFALFESGRAPEQITFAGCNLDILVGLTAPLVAWLVASDRIGPRLVVLWNVLGLAVLANTVGTVATSTPGPLHLDWSGAPLTSLVEWPIVWLPAFLMPTAVFLHVVSLRQNLRAWRAGRVA